jgi:hypothetical protein
MAGTPFHATLAGLNARLDLVFPATTFGRPIVNPKLTTGEWKELTQRTPLVGIGWDALAPTSPESRLYVGTTKWTVFLVARNVAGPLQRLAGDALGVGLWDMVTAATAVLHGATIPDVGTAFVSSVQSMVSEAWDMENLVLACLDVSVGVTMTTAAAAAAAANPGQDDGVGLLQTLGITWSLDGGAQVEDDGPIVPVVPRARIGAIRWDAWYALGSDLTNAVTADLTPPQFQDRLPFWATVSGGTVVIDGGHQAVIDAEIAQAASAGLDFWAFLGHAPGTPERTAFDLYLTSGQRSRIGFCLIESMSDLWFGDAPQPSFAACAAATAEAGYVRVLGSRPLLFILDSGDADIALRYGSWAGLGVALHQLRGAVAAAAGTPPYLVLLCPDIDRAASLALLVPFDAIGAYAAPPAPNGPAPYSALRSWLVNWWDAAAAAGPIVPPLMAGWAPSPRAVTPNALLGEQNSPVPDLIARATPADLAAHVAEGLAWMAANPGVAPAQIGLLYAWNEFDEGGWVCPTYVAGTPAGDATRIAALATVLEAS